MRAKTEPHHNQKSLFQQVAQPQGSQCDQISSHNIYFFFFFMCNVCMPECGAMCMQDAAEVRRGHQIPGTAVIGGCEAPCL